MLKKLFIIISIILLANIFPSFSQDYPVVYYNAEYGLEIKFTKEWQEVDILEIEEEWVYKIKASSFDVYLPTRDPNWSSDYAGMFAITAFTHEDWNKIVEAIEKEEYELWGSDIGKNERYTFFYHHPNACPEDLYYVGDYKITIFEAGTNPEYYTPTINNLRFREGSNLKTKVIRLLRKGEKLIVLLKSKKQTIDGIEGCWVKVKTESGETGWCFDGYLEKL